MKEITKQVGVREFQKRSDSGGVLEDLLDFELPLQTCTAGKVN